MCWSENGALRGFKYMSLQGSDHSNSEPVAPLAVSSDSRKKPMHAVRRRAANVGEMENWMQRARSEFGAGEKNTNEPIRSSNGRRISKIERFEYTFLTQTVSLHNFYFQAQSRE